ncbi:MAG: protein kinase [Christensenella sp.]
MENHRDGYALWLYEEISELKQGKVFLVKHKQTNQLAVKRFVRKEQKDVYLALKNIRHKNLPEIYDVYEEGERCVILREYIDGMSLQEECKQGRHFTARELKAILLQLCDALHALHTHTPPIIHRDIKLSNVVLAKDGTVKLIDFDAARFYDENAAEDTTPIGTHGYAAPEAYGFFQTDAKSDIYSLGVLLNLLIIGKKPNEQLANGKFRDVIKRCTNLSPQKRYGNVAALKRALKVNKNVVRGIVAVVLAVGIVFSCVAWDTYQKNNPPPSAAVYQNIDATTFDNMGFMLSLMATVQDNYKLEFPQGQLTNKYIDYFLLEFSNFVLNYQMDGYTTGAENGVGGLSLKPAEVNSVLSAAFGADRMDDGYTPENPSIVTVQDGLYYITGNGDRLTTATYAGTAPLKYNDQAEYHYTMERPLDGDQKETYDLYVRLQYDTANPYGYYITSVRQGERQQREIAADMPIDLNRYYGESAIYGFSDLLQTDYVQTELAKILSPDEMAYYMECMTQTSEPNMDHGSYQIMGAKEGAVRTNNGAFELTAAGTLNIAFMQDEKYCYATNDSLAKDHITSAYLLSYMNTKDGTLPITFLSAPAKEPNLGNEYRNDVTSALIHIAYYEDVVQAAGVSTWGETTGNFEGDGFFTKNQLLLYPDPDNPNAYVNINACGDYITVIEPGNFGGTLLAFGGSYKKVS